MNTVTEPGGLSFMRAVRLVARREFTERGRDRGFLISAGVMTVILVVVAVLPGVLGGKTTTYDVAFTGSGAAALGAAANAQAAAVGVKIHVHDEVTDPAAATSQVRAGKLDAAVEDGRVVVHRSLADSLAVVLQGAWAGAQRDQRLAAQGVDVTAVDQALHVAPMPTVKLDPHAKERDQRRTVAYVGVLLLYGMLILFCSWVANGIVEEKSSRVVEILLAAVPARALLAGKVIGIGLLGLAQMAVTAVAGLTVASMAGSVSLNAAMLYPAALVLMWFVIGYAVFSCLFAAAASRVSRQEDLQNVLGPATALLVGSFMVAIYTANSGSPVVKVLAYIPPFSAMLQPILTAAGDLAPWQNAVAAVLALGAVVGLVRLAGRMYEGAVLRMGGKVSLSDAWKR